MTTDLDDITSTHMSRHTSAHMSHVEVIRTERRRRWLVEQKRAIVAESQLPGASFAGIRPPRRPFGHRQPGQGSRRDFVPVSTLQALPHMRCPAAAGFPRDFDDDQPSWGLSCKRLRFSKG